ncbi:MAG: SPFH domain-containing protein [Phycisphaerales bacterium]
MVQFFLGLVFVIVAIGLFVSSRRDKESPHHDEAIRSLGLKLAGVLFFAIGIFLFASTSFVIVGADEVGHLKKIYLGRAMKPGQVIAFEGENGPQARILTPGFHFSPFLRVIYKVEFFPVLEVPSGFCGKILASDGLPLRTGQVFADEWQESKFLDMLNAEYFLKNGGQKGPQLSVLKPGKYRLNHYLFTVDARTAVKDIPAGFVGVVKSNVQQAAEDPNAIESVKTGLNLTAEVVPVGYKGVWKKVLMPGQYYLNDDAYKVIEFDTRIQTWEYSGGYHRRWIDLEINQEGEIQQKTREADIPFNKDAADMAIAVKVEGWEFPLDLRVLVQVSPEMAPYVVASVGNIQEIEDDILTPTIRSVIRNVCGKIKVFDLIDKRSEIEDQIESKIIPEGDKAWISIKEIRIGDVIIPPELLVSKQREQLAGQLKRTFEEEKIAQETRIETEKKRAMADQQPILMAAQIEKDAAEFRKDAAKFLGEGEKLRLVQIAEGQKAQADILGQDKVMQLAMLKDILEAAKEKPEIVKVPTVLVQGTGQGFEGAAAVLGASNIMQVLSQQQKVSTEQGKK